MGGRRRERGGRREKDVFNELGLSADGAGEFGHPGLPEAGGQCCESRHRQWETGFSQLLGDIQGQEHLARIQWALGLGKGH